MDQTVIPFELLQLIVTFLGALLASSGFWLFITKRHDEKDARNKLLVGLAHDRIVWLAMQYIHREVITRDEYENLVEYLYKPYLEMGGNGTAKRVMAEIEKLPIQKSEVVKHD